MAKTDYNKISTKDNEKNSKNVEEVTITPEVVKEETKSTELEETTIEPMVGIVSDCEKLNIRNTPDLDSEILAVVKKGTEVLIDDGLSTDYFYSVTTCDSDDAPVIGYAMKDYITLK